MPRPSCPDTRAPPQETHRSCVDVHVSARRKGKADDDCPVQSVYLHDLSDFVRPVAQSLSWVWQARDPRPSTPIAGPRRAASLHCLDQARPTHPSSARQDTNRPVANPGQTLSAPSTPNVKRTGSSQHLHALQASAQSLISSHLSTGALSVSSATSSASIT